MPAPPWSDWQPLPLSPPPRNARVLGDIMTGGQAFRWVALPDGSWEGVWGTNLAHVKFHGGGVFWRAPSHMSATTARSIHVYFAMDRDYPALESGMPWRSDTHLARCIEAFPGLRILRQPFGETLLGFLCSATKQIVQIRQMMALLAQRHGAPIAGTHVNRLPTWDELARVPESELRACLLGFRARFIHQTAQFLAKHPGWLDETERLPYPEAKLRLLDLPGVGEKIADCVLLYGAGRMEAFPSDVWILKAMANRYGLTGWKPPQVALFGRAHFGPYAGLAQQYLFEWERVQGASRREV